jgi:hypothetical protein
MEWVLFVIVFFVILGFVMRDKDPKSSEALQKTAPVEHREQNVFHDMSYDPTYGPLSGNIFHNSSDD